MKFDHISFELAEFRCHGHPSWRAWAPVDIGDTGVNDWYSAFKRRVIESIGKDYLPVMRLADGEFSFLFGRVDANSRWPFYMRMRHNFLEFYRRRILRRNFSFRTRSTVSSASYTPEEWQAFRQAYSEALVWIANHGLLAPQMAFMERPTMEQFQARFFEWLSEVDLNLNLSNMAQFYFVYALLLSSDSAHVISDRRILVVHGATGERQRGIIDALYGQGAKDVGWMSISNDRSMFDSIDCSDYIGQYDLAFVGAGVGKPMVMRQLEPLSVPIIDIGYVFEVWLDGECRHARPFCCPDDLFDPSKAKVHPTMRFILESK